MSELYKEYARRYEQVLIPLATHLQDYVSTHFRDVPRVDRITARAKTPTSFVEKATQTTDDGSLRYTDPLLEVQDIIGARIIVFYKDDVDVASEIIHRYFRSIEKKVKVPEHLWQFGYFGLHLILDLPEDLIFDERRSDVPEFFELQIKTLFQHAWSEANHDLGYKREIPLSAEQERRLAFSAAQAWGADREFKDLHAELTLA